MKQVILVSLVACLVASWIYILLLKVKIRDCMSYIQNRIDRCNSNSESADCSGQGERGTKGK